MKKILYSFLIFTALASCSGPKLIGEEDMQAIITQALISDAVISRTAINMPYAKRVSLDSADIYVPILEKYGYTLADFNYTVTTLAVRKSNPLDNIFKNVSEQINRYDAVAAERYQKHLQFDTLARNYFADTIYRDDKTKVGSLAKYKIELLDVKAGVYYVTFDYTTLSDNRVGSKSLRYEATGKSVIKSSSTFWLGRDDKPMKFKQEFRLGYRYDTLKLNFIEPTIAKDINIKDTTEISHIRIIHYPETTKARLDYFFALSGFAPSLKEYYEKQFPNLSDSITIPFMPGRQFDTQWSGGIRPSRTSGERSDSLPRYRFVTPNDIP